MSLSQIRPVVAIEAEGVLVRRATVPGRASFPITFRRDSFPSRFVAPPRWDSEGIAVQRWEPLDIGIEWVESLLVRGIEVVWASRYQQFANTYFASHLGLPDLPVAALDDGKPYSTESTWKAQQLGDVMYAKRPLLWVTTELTTSGRHLLERVRMPAMRALTLTKYIPEDSPVSEGDLAHMNEWLESVLTEDGQDRVRWVRARFLAQRRPNNFSDDRLQQEWVAVRERLQRVLDSRSGLAAPLAAYALDHIGELDIQMVTAIRDEWGMPRDPAPNELLPLLESSWEAPTAATPAQEETVREEDQT